METKNFGKIKMIMDKISSVEDKIDKIEYFRSKESGKNGHKINHKVLIKFDGPFKDKGRSIEEWVPEEFKSNLMVSFIQVHFLKELKNEHKKLKIELSKLI